jgi:hypothetical protein
MAEIRTVTTLNSKRIEIERSILHYEKALAQARSDLAHIKAAIVIFEATGEAKPYVDLNRLFRYRELFEIAKVALASGPLTTRDICVAVMTAKGLDGGDAVLAKALNLRIVNALTQHHKRGNLRTTGKVKGVRVWALQTALPASCNGQTTEP